MVHALSTLIWIVAFVAAAGALQLFVMAAVVDLIQRKMRRLPGRGFNWALISNGRGTLH